MKSKVSRPATRLLGDKRSTHGSCTTALKESADAYGPCAKNRLDLKIATLNGSCIFFRKEKKENSFMPYKDPERKRQWEREHREERNARRRRSVFPAHTPSSAARPAPDPISPQEPGSAWEIMAGIIVFALAVGIALFAAWNKSGAGSDSAKPSFL